MTPRTAKDHYEGGCCDDGSPGVGEGVAMKRNRRSRLSVQAPSAFAGFRFPPEVILLAVRWYLRYGWSYRVRRLLHQRGIDVDPVTRFRWVQRFTPELIDAARPSRHGVGDRWFVDETYVKVSGVWRYVYRAVDQHGQVIDVFVSRRRDIASARRFFTTALAAHRSPVEVITDRAPALANVIEELFPAAFHNTGQYENNRCECDHGQAQGPAAADARAEDRSDGERRDPRACVCPEPAARPLRTGSRDRARVPLGDRFRRTPARNLNDSPSAHDPARHAIA